jgi:hypothetical protein
MAVEDKVDQACKWMQASRTKVLPAFRNMRELQPGFSSKTPGNGDPGGGGGGHGPSIVERLVDDNGTMMHDDAMADLALATELAERMYKDTRDFIDLMHRWGYTTAGEHNLGERRQPGRPTEGEANKAKWCSHHAKFNQAEPLGPKGRGGLCGWCYEFERAEGELPPASFIEYRRSHTNLTTAMMDAWRKARVKPIPLAAVQRKRRVRT